MISWVPPAAILIAAAFILPVLQGRARQAFMVLAPALAFVNLLAMPEGSGYAVTFLDYEMVLGKVDRLSKVFGYIFVIMAFGGALFSLHTKEHEKGEMAAAFLYAGSALGVVFSGDYLSLFIFWEIMALGSTYLIWARGTKESSSAGLRYIVIHLIGGLLLLAGIVMQVAETGSMEFGYLGLDGLASWLILLGFAVNAAIPPFSAWLSDSYPESTVTGAVFLSAFTSKTAVYVLARAFPGTELLIWAGVIMTLYGIVFAILENDMRRVLSYSIINQVGFMVVGIGIGTELAINGAASHAFAHILYKALLMMSAGGVLYMTGRSKCTELGGLYKSMPVTMALCCVGAAAISAFPLTGGFVSKSMVIAAAGEEHLSVVWHLLMLASAGVFLHAGIKFPYFVFFAKDSGLRPKEPPANMIVAMAFIAFLCIFIGVFPVYLYDILPYPVDFVPYTAAHVVMQLQILLFSALAFFALLGFLKRTNTITLDTDWFYRAGTSALMRSVVCPLIAAGGRVSAAVHGCLPALLAWASRNPVAITKIAGDTVAARFASGGRKERIESRISHEKAIYPGDIIRHWPIGATVLWVTLFLLVYLLLYYI